jgi:hypothetical protein
VARARILQHFEMYSNLAESVGAGFQFNCYDIFNDKTLNYRHLDHFSGLIKFTEKSLFYH